MTSLPDSLTKRPAAITLAVLVVVLLLSAVLVALTAGAINTHDLDVALGHVQSSP